MVQAEVKVEGGLRVAGAEAYWVIVDFRSVVIVDFRSAKGFPECQNPFAERKATLNQLQLVLLAKHPV
jgi:hypothetical protein